MKSIRVQYQVSEDYVETNKSNIEKVMSDLRSNPIPGFQYASYYLGEGKFMHVSNSVDEETASKLNEVQSFNDFRMQLKTSNPVQPPKSDALDLVGSNTDLI